PPASEPVGLCDLVRRQLPAPMKEAQRAVCALLEGLFRRGGAIGQNGLPPQAPRQDFYKPYDAFALFVVDTGTLGEAPLGHVGTQAFIDSSRDLEENLTGLPEPR